MITSPAVITPAGVYSPRRIVEQRVAAYVPRDAPPAWDRVGPKVRELVQRADPLVVYDATELMSVTAKLAIFCDGQGLGDATMWLQPSTIDLFLEVGCAHVSAHTRSTYRAKLRRLAEAVLGVDEAKPIPLSKSDTMRPYTSGEITRLWSSARGQPTNALRVGLEILLTLGLGCGLSSDEIAALRVGCVRQISDGAVVVEVVGRRARLVVCRRQWESVLAEHTANAREAAFLFRPGTVRGKNLITNFVARAHFSPTTPPLKIARLRDTWVATHLAAGTPLPVLVSAAGLDGLSSLDRVLPYLPVAAAERAEQHLRDLS